MKDMTLKAPTTCCGATTLIWVGARERYVCPPPCGKTVTYLDGRPVKKAGFTQLRYGKKSHEK